MKAQLFICAALAFASPTSLSLACGPDSSDQLSHPEFSVQEVKDHTLLKLNGTTAQFIFDHLKDPDVRRFQSNFFHMRVGYGITCVNQPAHQHYLCWEKLADEGSVKNFLPYKEELKNSASWVRLNLKGPAMEQLYNKLSDDGDVAENEDGTLAFIKQRTAITCTKLVSPDGSAAFECSQLLSGGGLPIGPGSDPMIGSGTHPVQLDVAEGGN
ncbi:MAG TPA: hypothetical protein VFO10_09635 [Oligoflexus sp.]|uniref:hypothetical protein n=1 Tax=Oligoflexus sp. TaxID=1971216 RepID=UPI002D807694|nr:hypothetical protein [Oligoflexus sp.]HET9237500.1 hypothetical protein [Oligoflexus sp.]